MLGDFAGKLWNFITGVVSTVLNWFGDAFKGLFSFLGDLFSSFEKWLSGLLQSVVNAIATFLQHLFQPLLDLIGAIFHLIWKLIQMLGLLLMIFLQIGHVIIAMIEGLFRTLAGLTYNGSTPVLDANMSGAADAMTTGMSILQLDNIAYVCLFLIWMMTAVYVIRMIGNFRGGA